MRISTLLLIAAIAVASPLYPLDAQAEPIVLYDTVGNGQFARHGFHVFAADFFEAYPFVPFTTTRLSSVDIGISRAPGSQGSPTALVTVYADRGGLPGDVLERMPVSLTYHWVDFDPPPPVTVASAVMPVLTTGRQYWLGAAGGTDTIVGAWAINGMEHVGPSAVWSDGSWHFRPELNGIGGWTSAFRVTGLADQSAVPEPTSILLLSLGVGGAVIRRLKFGRNDERAERR